MTTTDELQNAAAARAAVETLLYDVEDTIQDVAARLMHDAQAGVQSVQDTMAPAIGRLYEAVDWPGPLDDGADKTEWAPVLRLLQSTSDALAEQQHTVDTVAARMVSTVGADVHSILPSTGEIFSSIVGIFGRLIDGLLGALSTDSSFWQSALETIRAQLGHEQPNIGDWLFGVVAEAVKHTNELGPDPKEIDQTLIDWYNRERPDQSGTVEAYIANVNNQPKLLSTIVNAATAIATIYSWLNARQAGFLTGVEQTSRYNALTTPLSVSQLVDLLRMKLIGEDFAHEHAKRSGLSNELFDLLRKGDERLLDATPIMELWRRSGDDAVLDELYRLGYTAESVAALRELALAVATPSDVVRFLVRDVFDPDAIQSGRLDEDFEQKYNEDEFRKAGVSKGLARLYWMAHWSLPSPSQGYQMLHRGLIDNAQLQELLKLADYAPGWVQHLIDIAYNVPGRIDVRRMYEAGILTTHEELVHYYQLMGYSPEHSEILAQFAEKLKVQADESKADRRYGQMANALMRAYVVGTLSAVQAKDALIQLGFTSDKADLRVATAEYERQRARADTIRDAIGRQYVRGYLTEEATRAKLAGYGFDEPESNYLLDEWNVQRELQEETDAQRHQKDLTKSELIEAFRDGLITESDLHARLLGIGYDDAEATTLAQLEAAREVRADAKSVESSAHSQYIGRRIEAQEARAILEGIGYTPTRVAALLSRWEVERESNRPKISPAQLERMLMQGVIPLDNIEERLRQAGYDETDINALLTLYGTDVSIAEEKLKAQQAQFATREERLTQQGNRRLDLTQRGQDLGQQRFSEAQQGLQQRFEQGIESRAQLQTERLQTQTALQAQRIAAQTEKDAQALAAARERQATSLQAQMDRLQTQIEAADKRASDANAARNAALAQRAQLAQQAIEARDAQQQRQLQAQADRQQQNIDAADRRAASAATLKQSLADQHDALTRELVQTRDQLQQLRDIRTEAARIQRIGVTEQVAIRKEQRTAARRQITAEDAAANAAQLQQVELQKSAAIAEVNARFAALQAEITGQRQTQALARRQAAEDALAKATPASSLLDTVL